MTRTRIVLWFSVVLCFPFHLWGQTNCQAGAGPLRHDPPAGMRVEDLIKTFVAKEATFKDARRRYTYTEDIFVQTLLDFGTQLTPDGEFRQMMEVSYDRNGKRLEHITLAPQSTLRRISLGREDMDDFREFMAFALTASELPQYNVIYSGKQRVDDLETYVFEVVPRKIEKGRRYFQGQVWVDARDTVVVKTCGKSVPERIVKNPRKHADESLQPVFVTYREQFEGGYWFPTYMRSDDILQFVRDPVRVREVIKYYNYKPAGVTPGPARGQALRPETSKP